MYAPTRITLGSNRTFKKQPTSRRDPDRITYIADKGTDRELQIAYSPQKHLDTNQPLGWYWQETFGRGSRQLIATGESYGQYFPSAEAAYAHYKAAEK